MASVGAGAFNFSGSRLRDLIRFPFRQFVIDTELSQEEVVERLRAIVEPGNVFLAQFRRTNKLFAGEISPDGFKIMRLIYYGNGALPVVIGRFEPGTKGARVQVTMRPTRYATAFGTVWFGFLAFFVLAVLLAEIFSSRREGIGRTLMGEGIALGMGGFAYLIMAAPFGFEARKARGLLEETLQATPGPRIQNVLAAAPARLPRIAIFMLVLCAVATVASVGTVIVLPAFMMRSEPYHIAEAYVRSDATVQAELGIVGSIEFDRSDEYNLSYAGPASSATFALRVEGTHSNGTIFITMKRPFGVWLVSNARLREPSGRIVILQTDTPRKSNAPGP
jgi:hypothetical protein